MEDRGLHFFEILDPKGQPLAAVELTFLPPGSGEAGFDPEAKRYYVTRAAPQAPAVRVLMVHPDFAPLSLPLNDLLATHRQTLGPIGASYLRQGHLHFWWMLDPSTAGALWRETADAGASERSFLRKSGFEAAPARAGGDRGATIRRSDGAALSAQDYRTLREHGFFEAVGPLMEDTPEAFRFLGNRFTLELTATGTSDQCAGLLASLGLVVLHTYDFAPFLYLVEAPATSDLEALLQIFSRLEESPLTRHVDPEVYERLTNRRKE